MDGEQREWTYFDRKTSKWVQPYVAIDELESLHSAGVIQDHTKCMNINMIEQGPMTQSIPFSAIARSEIRFLPTVKDFLEARAGKPATVVSGPNNGGKSLLLKTAFEAIGDGGYLIGCNRFSHVDVLNSRKRERHESRRYYENFMRAFKQSRQNTENNELNLEQVLTGLKNRQRTLLFKTAGDLIGSEFRMERTDSENEFSPFQVLMDSENLKYGSTGTRLFLTILGILLDERFSTILIDEPEIGLSPTIQTALSRFLYDEEGRRKFCPHLAQLFVATHSHLFLDRTNYSNNCVVSKKERTVSINQVQSVSALHQLQFNMLGNDLESVFMPSAIVIVEGDSDQTFFKKVAQLHLPNRQIAIVSANGEGELEKRVYFFKQAFGDLSSSVYHRRLIVVFDQSISMKPGQLERQGVLPENI